MSLKLSRGATLPNCGKLPKPEMASQPDTPEKTCSKTCSKCKTTQPLACFSKDKSRRDGLCLQCKTCQKEHTAEHREKRRKYNQEYYEKNKDKLSKCYKAYREQPEIREKHQAYMREYYQKNTDRLAEYRHARKDAIKEMNRRNAQLKKDWYNKRRAKDPTFKMSTNLRTLLRKGLKQGDASKTNSAIELLGMDVETFCDWIEFQFESGMSWDNYGKDTWHIDHVLPVSRFDLANEAHQRVCFHWSNMRPLSAKANNTKRAQITLHDYFNNFVSAHRFIQKQGLGCREYQALRESLAWLRATI